MSTLYLRHFDLSKSPFQITPDLDFFFSGSQRGGVLTALLHVASGEEGIVTVVAEVGSGKTLLARLMLNKLPKEICTVYLANPCFSRDEIITAISRDLGIAVAPRSTEENLALLQRELLRRHGLGQRVVLVIDEAHAMPPESLEEVRLLSNLETEQHKLVNIILFGQPELDELLRDRRLRQVRDRVIHRFELPPLNSEEVTAYIDHRLRIAGWSGGRLFEPAAMASLIKRSQGRARRINLLADKALLAAYADGARLVSKKHVAGAAAELQPESPGRTWLQGPALRYGLLSLGLSVAMTATALGMLGWQRPPGVAPVAASGMAGALPAASPVKPFTEHRDTVASETMVRDVSPLVPPPVPPVVVAPSAPPSARTHLQASKVLQRTHALVEQSNRPGFTVQLASLASLDNLPGYLAGLNGRVDGDAVFAHERTYNGARSVAVYFGEFANENEARSAVAALPDELKNNRPQIRTWAGIRREPKP